MSVTRPLATALSLTCAAVLVAAPAPADPGGTLDYRWSVENRTGQPIALQMSGDDGGLTSGISYPNDAPMMPGTITSTLQRNPGTFARPTSGAASATRARGGRSRDPIGAPTTGPSRRSERSHDDAFGNSIKATDRRDGDCRNGVRPRRRTAGRSRAPSWPPVPPACGAVTDSDNLWDAAKDAQPGEDLHAYGNFEVVIPGGDRSRGYLVHHGRAFNDPVYQDYDKLVIPTARVTGIECPNLVGAGVPELFKDAREAKSWLPLGTVPAMGVNSMYSRGLNQLHIHQSRLKKPILDQLASQVGNLAPNQGEWLDQKHRITLGGHTYGGWKTSDLNHNFFARLNEDVVAKIGRAGLSMADQTLLITPVPGGFAVLSSDSYLDGGTSNSDFALDRNGDPTAPYV
jgi:CDP-diacylglycerol pyrophosphatase